MFIEIKDTEFISAGGKESVRMSEKQILNALKVISEWLPMDFNKPIKTPVLMYGDKKISMLDLEFKIEEILKTRSTAEVMRREIINYITQ